MWREIEVRGLVEAVAESVTDLVDVETVERVCVLRGLGYVGSVRSRFFDEVSDFGVELVDFVVLFSDFGIEVVDSSVMSGDSGLKFVGLILGNGELTIGNSDSVAQNGGNSGESF